jgi:UDPglucose 6-dehydrogenase
MQAYGGASVHELTAVPARSNRAQRVAVVGSGYVGTVVASTQAFLGHHVVAVESARERLTALRSGRLPFYEPGADELLTRAVDAGRLCFTDRIEDAMRASDVIFLCVGTPSGPDGHADVSALASVASVIAGHIDAPKVLVTKSTVPVGSGEWLRTAIEDAMPRREYHGLFSVVSNPEFLRQGSAVSDYLHPDRVVLGGDDAEAVERVVAIYRPILEQSFPGGNPECRPALVRTGLATAETVKYASNAFLALKVSFANELANISELVGADVVDVMHAIGLDSRIGRRFLDAGAGWGGSCFGKDLGELIAAAEDHGYDAQLLRAARDVNYYQRRLVVNKLRRRLHGLRGRRVAILGLSFKPATDDLRDAPAVDIATALLASGACVAAHDPVVQSVPGLNGSRTAPDPHDALDRADAAVLLTEWPSYQDLVFEEVRDRMRGRLFVDARNFLDPAKIEAAGLEYDGMGRRVAATLTSA